MSRSGCTENLIIYSVVLGGAAFLGYLGKVGLWIMLIIAPIATIFFMFGGVGDKKGDHGLNTDDL